MSQGLIPISFSIGVAPEIIQNGQNGYIVSTEKEAEIYARELLNNNEKRLSMANAAKKTAEKFCSANIATDLIALYQNIKKEKRDKNKNGNNI